MQTLDAFLQEAGLPSDAGTASRNSFTIEKLLDEKKTFDLSVKFEKLGSDGENDDAWSLRCPYHFPICTFAFGPGR